MSINFSIGQFIVWMIIGALAGSLAGVFIKGSRKGFGFFINLIIGLMGALLGGFLFDLFNIKFGLGRLVLSYDDLVAAIAGSLIFLVVLSLIRK